MYNFYFPRLVRCEKLFQYRFLMWRFLKRGLVFKQKSIVIFC